jgi:hypothetical protein
MYRSLIWGLVLLVPLPAVRADDDKKADDKKADDKGMVIKGKLDPNDPKDKLQTNSPHKVHEKKMKSGESYQIDLVSRDFDSFLRVEDSAGTQLAVDDDSGGMLNARLVFRAPKDDTYRIIVTSLDAKSGEYTLTFSRPSRAATALSSVQSELQKSTQALQTNFFKAKTQDEKDAILSKYFDASAAFIERFAKVARDFPGTAEARQASMLASQNLGMLGGASSPAVVKIVRNLAEKSSDESIQNQAGGVLGRILRNLYEKAYDKKDPKAPELYQEAEKTLTEFSKKAEGNAFLKKQLDDALFELQKLSVGKTAPEIDGEDLDGKKFKLSDYRGKVVVLDFWGNW